MRRNKKNIYKSIFLLFFALSNLTSYSQEVIIKNGDQWNYYDSGYLKDNWFKKLNNSDWKTGYSPLGYGDRLITTSINYGKDQDDKDIIKYFTKKITIKDISKFKGFEFRLQRDDGAIVYVNGKELYRDNMPDGHITHKTKSIQVIDVEEEGLFFVKIFDSTIFKNGDNTISIQVHQCNTYSSDCIFSLEVVGHTDPNILTEVIKEHIETKSSLESKIDNLNNTFILKNTTTQLDLYKNSNQNLKFLLFLVCFLLIITITGGFIIYLKNRNNEDTFKNTIQRLSFDVIENEKQMVSFSTQLLHYRQHLKEVKADLSFLKTDNNKALNNTIKQIDFIIDNNDEWEQLKLHFDSVFSGFYDALLAKSPTLTETELRHCMFIKLHIQTKEIARILNVEPRSVQVSRYRIKKKMNLDEETDLRNYIVSIV
jgi:DNA-binding CsgD family transcriptional regulator